jgi:manganese transport protein
MNTKNDDSLSEVHGSINTGGKTGWRKLFAFIGPAYLVSVGYMDPGNWATDIAGGSQFGYKLIWVLLMSNLMALLLQSLSARYLSSIHQLPIICFGTNCHYCL